MKALTMNESRQLVMKEVPPPRGNDRNMIIKVRSAAVCGTDMRTWLKGNRKVPPQRTLGHEFAGVVTEAGALAQQLGFDVGSRVSAAPVIGCGECCWCRRGLTNICDQPRSIGYEYEGAFAEYLEIPEQALKMGNVVTLPEQISDDQGALIEPAACVLNGQSYLQIGSGDTVVIYGGGMIGGIHAEMALEQGAEQVIIVGHSVRRGQQLKQLIPGLQWLDGRSPETGVRLQELNDGAGADVVITAVSDASTHREAQLIAAKRGRISLFGGLPGESGGYLDSNLIHYKELQVFGASATNAGLMQEVIAKIITGRLNLEKYIEQRVSLADAAAGFVAIRDDKVLKVVIHP